MECMLCHLRCGCETRTRTTVNSAVAPFCTNHSLVEQIGACPTPIDCGVGLMGHMGRMQRNVQQWHANMPRNITVIPVNGGAAPVLEQTQGCNTHACEAVRCQHGRRGGNALRRAVKEQSHARVSWSSQLLAVAWRAL